MIAMHVSSPIKSARASGPASGWALAKLGEVAEALGDLVGLDHMVGIDERHA